MDQNGIWIGPDAVVARVSSLQIAFLRLEKDYIVSVLSIDGKGVLGVAEGHSDGHAGTADMAIQTADGQILTSAPAAEGFISLHSANQTTLGKANGAELPPLTYTLHNGRAFSLFPAEAIDQATLTAAHPVDEALSPAEKMARWIPQSLFDHGPYHITAGIDTARYSIFFNLAPAGGGYAYCRVGQNSFSDKGRAMRSTICLRQNEVRMIEDNLSSLSPYEANPAWFSKDACTFPADGGWYWPVSSVSEDQIILHGCNGDVYTIERRKA